MPEVPLKIAIEEDEYQLVIEGRADGILIESAEEEITFADNFNHMTMPEDCKVTIDEIKGMYMKLDLLDDAVGVHRARPRRCVMPISMPCSMILPLSQCR